MTNYDELLACYEGRKSHEPEYGRMLLSTYKRYSMYARLSLPLMALLQRPNPQARYHLVGRRLLDLAKDLPIQMVELVGNPLDYLACREKRISFLQNNRAWILMNTALESGGMTAALIDSIRRYVDRLARSIGQGYLLVWNDSNPVERLMVLAAREAGIITICVQHGLVQKAFPHRFIDGRFTDFRFVYDDWQRGIFSEIRSDPRSVKVMGFHCDFPGRQTLPTVKSGPARRVCYLGQPFGRYDQVLGERYLQIVRKVLKLLEEAGHEIYYKPHPGEIEAEYLREFSHIYKGGMMAAFESFDVFISLTSTALLEASLNRRVALQVYDPDFFSDDFAVVGYAYSLPGSDLSGLCDLVRYSVPLTSPMLENMVAFTASTRLQKTIATIGT